MVIPARQLLQNIQAKNKFVLETDISLKAGIIP